MSVLASMSEWASGLTLTDVPDPVIQLAKSQVISYLAAARAGLDHPVGKNVTSLYGLPFRRSARSSASALCALGGFMHFDDTAYAGHLSQSAVSVPMAYAYHLGQDGAEALRAVVLANEIAARISAATTLGPHRGQAALHTQTVGSIAGRAAIERLGTSQLTNALGLGLSVPPWSLRHGLFDSDADIFGPAAGLRGGLDAVDAALAGWRGPADIVEHPDGFLARYADLPLPAAANRGLGTRWHTQTLSIKVHPGGPGVDAAIDASMQLHASHGPFRPSDVAEVIVSSSIYTSVTDSIAARYLRGPASSMAALVLGVAYPVAVTLLRGRFEPTDLRHPALADPERWALADKVRVAHDPEMTRSFLASTAPVGEALREAGAGAHGWLTQIGGPSIADLLGEPGPPSQSFAGATKVTPARVEILTHGGAHHRAEVWIPLGAAGPDTARCHRRYAAAKLVSCGGGWMLDFLEDLEDLEPGDLHHLLASAFAIRPGVTAGTSVAENTPNA
jgi:2-methylcitrate dehydratase PrpD